MRIPEDGVTPRSQAKNQEILMEIAGQIRDYVKDKPCKVYPASLDARFPESDEADDAITMVVYTKGDEIKSGAVKGLAVSLDSVFVE